MSNQAAASGAHPPARTKTDRWRPLGWAAGGGLVAALATPPTSVYPAMVVGLAMLALAARQVRSVRGGLAIGCAWATVGGLVGMRFVPSVIMTFTDLGTAAALLAHLLLSAAQSLHWAVGMALAALLARKLATPLPLRFGAGVLLAISLPSVFVWTPAGLLSPWPALVQAAELVGERGVSVLLAVAAALLAESTARLLHTRRSSARTLGPAAPARALGPAGLALGLLGLMTICGAWAMDRYPDGPDRVDLGLVHAAVSPKRRWRRRAWPAILSALRTQTAAAERAGVELSIWPEAAYPYRLPNRSRRAPTGRRRIIGGAVRGPILLGLITSAEPVRQPDGSRRLDRFNSATIVTPDHRLQAPYDKMELLWFGETVPLGEQLPWLRRIFQRSGGLIAGRQLRALQLERQRGRALRLELLNCYEDTLPALARHAFAKLRPNLLVNVTNDAWFAGTAEPELHLRLAAMRAIELRRDLVRAVNLGVSGWVDAAGRVRARSDSAEPGWLRVRPTVRAAPPTLYARLGDWPMWLMLLCATAEAALHRRRMRATSRGIEGRASQ